MRVLIVEDEPQAVERLVSLIAKVRPGAEIAGVLDSVKSAVRWFSRQQHADLALMDIQLGDGLSFDIFQQVRVNMPVIFVTAYDEYALKAFKVNSIDYILKPVDESELGRAFDKFESMKSQFLNPNQMLHSIQQAMQMLTKKYKERFVVKVGEHLRSIETREVLFFNSMDKATFCFTDDGRKHVLDFTLDQLEQVLDPAMFFRINRKYIVSVESIHDMISHVNSRLKLVLKKCNDSDVVVARERVQAFKEWLDR